MLTAILCVSVFNLLFTMAMVGHLSTIEKILKALVQAKINEMNMWNGK